ncbi:hypothetical protein [Flavobacterium sp. LC2016-12]|uniref:hypothetical protein n=1 Tax=Flavobacterium sp. LC2016-12 TaxID=2783794 RepID=UPI00188A6755|nr:hypothetical protein [Flavobacterium sp. LC2016-12]MBF4466787.1 hypothetical protein [Flavobacterium sp. LC2016-12]
MKKLLLFFIALNLVLTSCSNDDNSPNGGTSTEDTSILPKTISYIYPSVYLGTNSKSTLTYDGNKLLSSIKDGSKTIFTYNGNVIVKQEKFNIDTKGVETKDTEVLYTYQNNRLKTRIIREEFSTQFPDGQFIDKTVYTHTSQNLSSFTRYSVDPGTKKETKGSEGNLTYKDGNLVKIEQINDSSTATRTYEYDTKNNPLKNILGFDLLLNEISEFGKNNIVKTTAGTVDTTSYLTTYIYNDKNYPTKHTSFAGDGKSIEYEIEYTY